MVLASRLLSVRVSRRVARSAASSVARRSFASAAAASGSEGSQSVAYSGKATHAKAVPVTGVDEREFSFARMLAANQKLYNAQHHPSTPVPAPYRAITRVTNVAMDFMYVVAFIGMGACMSTGIWAPYAINAQRRAAEKRFAPLKGEIN